MNAFTHTMRANYSNIMTLIPWISSSGELNEGFGISKSSCCEEAENFTVNVSGLVLVNGCYRSDLSQIPQGLVAMPMSKAYSTYGHFLNEEFARFSDTPFSGIYNRMEPTGLFLYVHKRNVTFDLEVLNYVTDSSGVIHPFICIVVGKDCQVGIKIRTHHSDGCHQSHVNGRIGCFVEESGSCHLDLVANGRIVEEIWTVSTQLKALASQNLAIIYDHKAAGLKFYDCHMVLNGKSAAGDITLKGGLKCHDRLFMNICMEHMEPETTSNQNIRTVLEDSAQLSFQGGIYIHAQAQGTHAYQRHDSLLFSQDAVVETRPSLEIFADDVKASHGATIGQLEELSVSYLRARGLSRIRIFDLLKKAFLEEVSEFHGSQS